MLWWYTTNGQQAGPVRETELRELIFARVIEPNSLVWAHGMPSWMAASGVPEFAELLRELVPPPLPTVPPPLPKPQREDNRYLNVDVGFTGESGPEGPAKATAKPPTWYRYFARHVDVVILGYGAVMSGAIGIGALGGEIRDERIATISGLVMLNLLMPLVEGVCMCIFGNTPGKKLFGLIVRKVDGTALSLQEASKRAYLVTLFGIGLYLPVISLFTCLEQLKNVRRRGAAGYDEGQFQVNSAPLGRLRTVCALGVWALCFVISIALSVRK